MNTEHPGTPRTPGQRTVIHVSTVHPWDDNRIFGRECRSLARHGYSVTLIARTDQARHVDGVNVLPAPGQSGSRWSRILLGVPLAVRLAWRCRADVYHLHDPELIPAIPLLRLRGARVVYDAHEDLPVQILDKTYLPEATRRGVALLTRLLCWLADRTSSHVVAATPTIARRFTTTSTTVVHNYPELLPVDTHVDYDLREDVMVYAGGISPARGAAQMVIATNLADLKPDWRMILLGPLAAGTDIARLSKLPGWDRVDFRGRVEPPIAREIIARSKVGLVLFQPTPAHVNAMPTKLFEYMAAGVPVIASDFPLWRSIVERVECGLLVDPTNPAAIADAMTALAQDPVRSAAMGERGRGAVMSGLNWSGEQAKIHSIYRRLACEA
jgi:glycosyltransferase involved in cell wall biosynthesis